MYIHGPRLRTFAFRHALPPPPPPRWLCGVPQGCETELFATIDGLCAAAERLGRTPAELALGWVLAQPQVTSVIFGVSKPEHVPRNVGAASSPLAAEVVEELTKLSEGVKAGMGANPDLWDDKDGGRYR